jgi:hypothetical protein
VIPPAVTTPADHIDAPPGFEPRPCVAPPPPPPSRAACVRHNLADAAYILRRRTLARACRTAVTPEEWQEVGADFLDALGVDELWLTARAAARVADAMVRDDVDEAAARWASYYGLTVEQWEAATAAEVIEARGGAR